MELLQEAGFTPLEVIRAATLDSAEWLRIADVTGSVEIGKRADIIITDRNPLHNLKVLYGTGVPGKSDDGSLQQVGGVRYAIKRGVIYNPGTILSNVRKLVTDAKDLAN
jgi:imidazolonepropionase-like amidohydrolase